MNLIQHPLSAAWPSMSDDEFQALKDSIKIIGIQNPITLFEGMVIDGWHRCLAGQELRMHCPSKLLGDVDPIDFVKSQNDARRHITASQKAAAITAIYSWKPIGANQHKTGREPGSPPQKSNAELAALAGVSDKTIKQAKFVQANATPEVKNAVRDGTMSVKKAVSTVNQKPPHPAAPDAPCDELMQAMKFKADFARITKEIDADNPRLAADLPWADVIRHMGWLLQDIQKRKRWPAIHPKTKTEIGPIWAELEAFFLTHLKG